MDLFMDPERTATTSEQTAWDCECDPKQVSLSLGGAETILLVEDEAFVRDVTREVLRSAGYTMLTARNSSEALRTYDQHLGAVNLVLTDVILPGETGRALATKLRMRNPELRVLFITGYAEQMGASNENDVNCLAKPFSTGILLAKIRQVLDRNIVLPTEQTAVKRAAASA